MNRFNNFQEAILQEISIQYLDSRDKIGSLKLYARDWNNENNDTWLSVKIEIINLLDYKILEENLTTHQVISNGISLLRYKNKLILEMGDLVDNISDISELDYSNFYFIGENIKIKVL